MADCPRHKHCAYTGTEPGLCPTCHATEAKCSGRHGKPASGQSWPSGVVTSPLHPTLKVGQYNDPRQAATASEQAPRPQQHTTEQETAA